MAGVKVTITDREFVRKIRALREGVRGPSALMKNWGEIAGTSILENFEVSGRPTKWKPLSKITIKLKGHARPLIGRTGNLMRITIKPEQSRVVIGTNPATKDYAARQQFGWPGGGGRYGGKVKTPARPFILLQPEDKIEMGEVARRFFVRLGT